MLIHRRLLPGDPGTKKYVERYGEDLVCVRYKYDERNGIKMKTVELVVSEQPWTKKRGYIPMNKNVYLRVEAGEKNLQRLIRLAGGRWNYKKQRWRLPYGAVRALGLEDRIDSSAI